MKCYYKMRREMRREMRQQRILKYTLLVFMSYATLFVLKDIILPEEEVYALEPGFPLIHHSFSNSSIFLSKVRQLSKLNAIATPLSPWTATSCQKWRNSGQRRSATPAHDAVLCPHRPRCDRLLQGDATEQKAAKEFMHNFNYRFKSDDDYIRDTRNCSRFIQERGYWLQASTEEKEFPIAFSIVLFRDTEQVERLLRAIYRPHNIYCLHVDKKAPVSMVRAIRGVASCLENVFVTRRSLDVEWGTFSVLEVELVCMKDLWEDKRWRYFINLTGQEFPLKTNLELVKILQSLQGANMVDCTTSKRDSNRWYNSFKAPHNIQPLKGNVHMVASRGFVDFILHDRVARDFLDWVRFTDVPDETFFATLNHNPHLAVPGSYLGEPDTDAQRKPFLARFKNWGHNWHDGQDRQNFHWPCYGKRVRTICVFGVGDLPMLTSRKELFANKFHLDFEPLALECMEEWLFNLTLAEYAGVVEFDTTFYEELDIVKNKIEPRLYNFSDTES